MNRTEHLLTLAEATDPALVGRKARGLNAAAALGLRVPEALVLSTGAFQHALRGGGGSIEEPTDNQPLPPPVRAAIDAAAEYFRDAPWGMVVRSSATAEDGGELSFAGQFKSVFCSAHPASVEAAVRAVWASAFSAPVRRYEALGGAGAPTPPAMAVILQHALCPWSSGVLAAAPGGVGGLLVEGTWGLAVPVVQGLIKPDVLVSPRPGEAKLMAGDRHVCVLPLGQRGDRERVLPGDWLDVDLGPRASGRWKVVWRDPDEALAYLCPPEALQGSTWLDAEDERALREIATALPASLPHGLDIEWARDGAGYHVLQVRPLTRPVPLELPVPSPADGAERPRDGTPVRGRPAAPGRASGPVWMPARGSSGDEMPGGSILVCSGLTTDLLPALVKAAGIVSTEAGVLAHTAIVARELGKPCVVDVASATQLFSNGEVIAIDGDQGTLSISGAPQEDPEEPEPPEPPLQQPVATGVPSGLLVLGTWQTWLQARSDSALWQRLSADPRWAWTGVLLPDVTSNTDGLAHHVGLAAALRASGWSRAAVEGGGEIWSPEGGGSGPVRLVFLRAPGREAGTAVIDADGSDGPSRECTLMAAPPGPMNEGEVLR